MNVILATLFLILCLFSLPPCAWSAAAESALSEERSHAAFLKAVFSETDTERIRVMLADGADVNRPNPTGTTPLMLAAMGNRNPAIVQLLIDAGVDCNAVTDGGATALVLAARDNPNPDIVKTLLRNGAVWQAGKTAEHPLVFAAESNANPDVLKALIEAESMQVNEKIRSLAMTFAVTHNPRPEIIAALSPVPEKYLNTPKQALRILDDALREVLRPALVRLLETGAPPESFRILLAQGADPLAMSGKRFTPNRQSALTLAAALSRVDVLDLFLDPEVKTNGDIMTIAARQVGDPAVFARLLERFEPDENDRLEVLGDAMRDPERRKALKDLVDKERKRRSFFNKMTDKEERTFLVRNFIFTEQDRQSLLSKWLEEAARFNQSADFLDYLLELMDDRGRGDKKRLPYRLSAAAQNPNTAIFDRLLELATTPEDLEACRAVYGWSTRIEPNENLPDIFRSLLRAGIRPPAPTPTLNVLATLISYGTNPQNGMSPINIETARVLIADGVQVSESPFLAACQPGGLEIARELVNVGVDPRSFSSGQDPVRLVIANDATDPLPFLRFLRDAGLPMDKADKYGVTPLLRTGDSRVVRFLLEAGADPNVMGRHGDTPLINTYKRGDIRAAALLLQAGAVVNLGNPAYRNFLRDVDKYSRTGLAELAAKAPAVDEAVDIEYAPVPQYAPKTLAEAVEFGADTETVKSLLPRQFASDAKQQKSAGGEELLALAVGNFEDSFFGYYRERPDSSLVTLLENGHKAGQCIIDPHVNSDTILLLIEAGARARTGTRESDRLLLTATRNNADARAIKALYGIGIDLSGPESADLVPLAYREAAGNGDPEVLAFIAEKFGAIRPDAFGYAVFLHGLEYSPNPEVAEFFLAQGLSPVGDGKGIPLLAAARNKRGMAGPMVSMLVENGADPNQADADGVTALIAAAEARQPPAAMRAILSTGANPNAQTLDGDTALHKACRAPYAYFEMARPFVLRDLLTAGADPKRFGADGLTPLMLAAGNKDSNDAFECVETLLLHGADPSARDTRGRDALGHAFERLVGVEHLLPIVELLAENGAVDFSGAIRRFVVAVNPSQYRTANYAIETYAPAEAYARRHFWITRVLDALLETGADPLSRDERGANALILACEQQEPDQKYIIPWLIRHIPDINLRDNTGRTALLGALSGKGEMKLLHMLLTAGADVNLADDSGMTPLIQLAANRLHDEKQAEELMARLIESGADVDTRDAEGLNALDHALMHNAYPSVIRLLATDDGSGCDTRYQGKPRYF